MRFERALQRLHRSTFCAGAVMLVSCAQTQSTPEPVTPPKFWGYVLRVAGSDTIRVKQAKVWTSPPSDAVVTDSLGFWTIDAGLVPGDYKVFSELEGVKGQTAKIPAELGKSAKIVIMLGAEETPWPPPKYAEDSVTITKGKGVVRAGCCLR